jgi:hypothetical protein
MKRLILAFLTLSCPPFIHAQHPDPPPLEVYVTTVNLGPSESRTFQAYSQFNFMWQNGTPPNTYQYIENQGENARFFSSSFSVTGSRVRSNGWEWNSDDEVPSIRCGVYTITVQGYNAHFVLEYRTKYPSGGPGDITAVYDAATDQFVGINGNIISPPAYEQGCQSCLTEPTTLNNSFGNGQIIYDGNQVPSGSNPQLTLTSHVLTAINGQQVGPTTYRFEHWDDFSTNTSCSASFENGLVTG